MIIKNKDEYETLKKAGAILRELLKELAKNAKPGTSTAELDELALKIMKREKVEPSFLNYKPYGHTRAYPAAICASVNDEVVHGIPNENPRTLKEGDLVTLDAGLWLDGICVDSALTVQVGRVSGEDKRLYQAAKDMRQAQIEAVRKGTSPADLGTASEKVLKEYGFAAPRILGGHGVGRKVHEEPFVPNYAQDGTKNYKFKEGEVLALEPIAVAGDPEVFLCDDGYTYKTKDGSKSAQFEHTVIVWEDGAEIIT